MASSPVTDSHADLLDRPLFAHLATVRPDGSPQRVALSIADPDDQYRFLEVRGAVESVEPDDEKASFYRSLQERYDHVNEIRDAPDRVIVTIRPESFVAVVAGTPRR